MTGSAATVPRHPGTAPAAPAEPSLLLRLSALDLRPLDTAVPSARLHTRAVLHAWGLRAAADAEVIVSELVTNAVRFAARAAAGAEPLPVRLRLSAHAQGPHLTGTVQVEVWDACDQMPAPRRGQPADEPGGRGLILVEALSARWGAYRTEGGGKCVWAVIGA
jgi:anti-sigma regulatory factor (Ser/Thr protein kinase)